MDYEDFKAVFDYRFKQTVTYRNAHGEQLKGLLISNATSTVIGSHQHYVYVNNFVTLVPLADVIALKTTEQVW